MNLPHYPLSNTGTNDAHKVNANLLALDTVINANKMSAYQVVTPEQYGAVGDGVTDDTVAIQTAINISNHIVFGAKTYRITDTLIIKGQRGFTLIGEKSAWGILTNSNCTVLAWDGAVNTKPILYLYNCYNVFIDGITFLGQNDSNSKIAHEGIRSDYNCIEVIVKNCYFRHTRIGYRACSAWDWDAGIWSAGTYNDPNNWSTRTTNAAAASVGGFQHDKIILSDNYFECYLTSISFETAQALADVIERCYFGNNGVYQEYTGSVVSGSNVISNIVPVNSNYFPIRGPSADGYLDGDGILINTGIPQVSIVDNGGTYTAGNIVVSWIAVDGDGNTITDSVTEAFDTDKDTTLTNLAASLQAKDSIAAASYDSVNHKILITPNDAYYFTTSVDVTDITGTMAVNVWGSPQKFFRTNSAPAADQRGVSTFGQGVDVDNANASTTTNVKIKMHPAYSIVVLASQGIFIKECTFLGAACAEIYTMQRSTTRISAEKSRLEQGAYTLFENAYDYSNLDGFAFKKCDGSFWNFRGNGIVNIEDGNIGNLSFYSDEIGAILRNCLIAMLYKTQGIGNGVVLRLDGCQVSDARGGWNGFSSLQISNTTYTKLNGYPVTSDMSYLSSLFQGNYYSPTNMYFHEMIDDGSNVYFPSGVMIYKAGEQGYQIGSGFYRDKDGVEVTTKSSGYLFTYDIDGLEFKIFSGGVVGDAPTWTTLFTTSATALLINSSTDSTSKDTGSIITEGGVGAEKAIFSGSSIIATTSFKVGANQVVGARVVDARLADAPNSGDATTDGLIDALRDLIISHGLGASS